ncbi:hypothetical protein HYT23_04345 [Candidatus Pacearchaeota archaeon]|nr:hypothetical protein [Candidatus Pacearchaeota archaeon]
MIKNQKPLSLVEATEYAELNEKTNLKSFTKKFTKLDLKDAKEIRERLEKLGLVNLDGGIISKIIDTLPENNGDLAKVSTGTNLSEEEIKNIINIIKEFK